MADPPNASDTPTPTPTTRRRRSLPSQGPRALQPTWPKLLIGALLPTIGLVWFLLMDEDARGRLLATIPEGASQRAIRAAAGLAALIVLAWFVLPTGFASLKGTGIALTWLRGRTTGARLLCFPLEVIVTLLWGLAGLVFYATAVAIVLVLLLALLMSIWIVMPDLLGGYEALVNLLPT